MTRVVAKRSRSGRASLKQVIPSLDGDSVVDGGESGEESEVDRLKEIHDSVRHPKRLRKDVEVAVGREFVVADDVARACTDARMQRVITDVALLDSASATAPKAEGASRHRLFFEMCSTAEGGGGAGASSALTRRFVEAMTERMRRTLWEDVTPRWTERIDYILEDGSVASTLLTPARPFVQQRVVRTKTHDRVLIRMEQPCRHRPNAVRVRRDEELSRMVSRDQFDALEPVAVDICSFLAFRSGAWVYRIFKRWRGATHSEARAAMSKAQPELRVTLELELGKYGRDVASEVARTLASGLLKMRDLCNDRALWDERTRFATSPAVSVAPSPLIAAASP